MQNPLFQNPRLSCAFLALTALLLAPAAGQAQAPNATRAIETDAARVRRYQEAQKQFAAMEQRYEDKHKSVIVTVDYVDVPRTDFLKVSQWIASGQGDDAPLLAALVKAGAQDTPGAQIQVWDKSTSGSQKTLREIDMGEGVVLDTTKGMQVREHFMRPVLVSYTGATPQFNADGTVTVLLRLILGPPPNHYPVPMTAEGYHCVKPTFHDGQTLLVENTVQRSATGVPMAHLAFVRVETKPALDSQ